MTDTLVAFARTCDEIASNNDYGFECVFARQVEALGRPGDVLVAISTSGRSPNVVAAAKAARALGLKVVGFTGADGSALREFCDVTLAVPATSAARIQELHGALGHFLCGALEESLGD